MVSLPMASALVDGMVRPELAAIRVPLCSWVQPSGEQVVERVVEQNRNHTQLLLPGASLLRI